MGKRIRLYEPGTVYSAVSSVVDRQFMLKPNHSRENKLLAAGCHPLALLDNNDITPVSSVYNTIGYAVGRALELHPLDLRWFASNINHNHSGVGADKPRLENISAFYKDVNRSIAVDLNRTWKRSGHLFVHSPRIEPCLDDRAAKSSLLYALGNPIKDGLIDTIHEAPFFSTYRHHAYDEPLRFWHVDRNAWWQAGGPRKKSHRLKDYIRWIEYDLPPPLPEWDDVPDHKWKAELRALARDYEAEQREMRRAEGRTVVGVPALYRVDPRDKPTEPRKSGPQPLCHASDPQTFFEYRLKWREFLKAYREASHDYRAGFFDREFPEGSFRPPLVTVYTSSRL